MARAWIRASTPANAINGFRGSGIYPVNPNAGELYLFIYLLGRERIQESEHDQVNVLSL